MMLLAKCRMETCKQTLSFFCWLHKLKRSYLKRIGEKQPRFGWKTLYSLCFFFSGLLCSGRPSGGKVRHKRQALQDMARPLKQWLYKHRDNPYPTKTEKILLALGSQMTLVQVSPASDYLFICKDRMKLKIQLRIVFGSVVREKIEFAICGWASV